MPLTQGGFGAYLVDGTDGGRFVNRPYVWHLHGSMEASTPTDFNAHVPTAAAPVPLSRGNKRGLRAGSAYHAFSNGNGIIKSLTIKHLRFKVQNFKSMVFYL